MTHVPNEPDHNEAPAPVVEGVVVPGTPTQVAHPWKAAWRTFWQALVPSLIVLVAVLPQMVQAFLDEFGAVLPPETYAWFTGVAVLIAGVGSLVSRWMAIPGVNDLMKKLGLGTGVENEAQH